MLPYTAYDIIRTVHTEVDLTRAPIREHQHAFGASPSSPDDRDGGGGGGFPITRALHGIARIVAPRRQASAGHAA